MQEKKIVVGLASIWAGGGHHALRDYLFEELLPHQEFDLFRFDHSDKSYDQFNDAFLGKFPDLFDIIYNNIPNEYPAVSALHLVEECERFIKDVNPDVLIATNYGLSSAFALVKKTLKLNFVNVYAIPDYGRVGIAAFPANPYLKPDHVLVFDTEAKKGIVSELNFPKNDISVSGYVAKQSFIKYVAENEKKSKEELIAEVGLPLAANKTTYLVTGGAGGVINKADPLLKKIAALQKKDAAFKQKNQYLIITGKNEKYFKKITKARAKSPEWSNIIPVGWINHETYAKLQLLADAPILITIAPATINELLEAKCGPFIIHHSRKAQEQANVDFVLQKKFGVFVPRAKEVIKLLLKGISAKKNQDFITRTEVYRQERMKKKELLPAEICAIYNKHISPKRKNDKKNLKFKLDITKLLTRDLFMIFLMMLPASIIYGYAQYYKQKSALFKNKYMGALYNTWHKFWSAVID